MNLDSFVKLLTKSWEHEKISVFAGAGVSFNSGIPLVLGENGIINSVLNSLSATCLEREHILNSEIPFELFMQSLIVCSDCSSLFPVFDSDNPSPTHELIAHLAKKGNLGTIVTTNFDLLFEKSLFQKNVKFKKYADTQSYKRILWKNSVSLIKLHGSLENHEELAITIKNISTRTNLHSRMVALRKVIQSKRSPNIILILGYSFSDNFDIIPELQKTKKINKIIYVVQHAHNHKTFNVRPLNNSPIGNIFPSVDSNSLYIEANTDALIREINRKLTRKSNINISSDNNNLHHIRLWGSNLTKTQSYYILGRLLYDVKALKLSYDNFKLALNKVEKENISTRVKANIFNNIAVTARHLGHYKEAMEYLKKAEKLEVNLNDHVALGRNYGNQAIVYKSMGHKQKAIKMHKKEEEVKKGSSNYLGLSVCYNNQALLLIDQKAYDEANKLLNIAEEIKTQYGDLAGLAYTYGNKARLEYSRKNYREALEFHKEEERLHKQLTNYAELAECLGNQARLHMISKDFSESLRLSKKEEFYCKRIGFLPGLINCYYKRAQIFESMNKIKWSISEARKSLTLIRKIDDGRKDEVTTFLEKLKPKLRS